MKILIKSFFLFIGLFAMVITSCTKDNNSAITKNSGSMKVGKMTIYEGNNLSNLLLKEENTYEYTALGNLSSRVQNFYDGATLLASNYFEYTYSGNTIYEADYFATSGSTKQLITSTWNFLNSNNLLVRDSSIDLTDPTRSPTIHHYIYESNNKHVLYSYLADTMDGSVYSWIGNNLHSQSLINNPGGRFEIMSYTYGNKLNTVDMGDFWTNGMKSDNLPETAAEPHYNYTYSYKIESDGFVSEVLMSTLSPSGGQPYHFVKTVFTRK